MEVDMILLSFSAMHDPNLFCDSLALESDFGVRHGSKFHVGVRVHVFHEFGL